MALDRLKALRVEKGLSQAELARQIGTTQQTVARWEAGKSVPSVRSLDVLAYILGTTVAYLLGQRPTSRLNKSLEDIDEEGIFWGHLSLLLPSWRQSQWYPVTDTTRDHLWSRLRNSQIDDENPWIVCETLNNRMLAFNPQRAARILLLDDDADSPDDGWPAKFPLDDYAGHPQAIYRAMDEWLTGAWGIDVDDEEARTQREVVKRLLKRAKLDEPDKLHPFLHHTTVHLAGGRKFELFVEPNELWSAMSDLELGLNRMVYLPTTDHDNDVFVPLEQLVLIEGSLIDAAEGRRAELEELGVGDELEDQTS